MLSIIIVSFNTADLLRDCLQSIFDSNLRVCFEVIVVDNNSSDNSVAMCMEEFPGVKIIANSTNNMFAKANNQGIEISKGEYVLLLNSDTVVPPGTLDRLYDFIRTKPQIAAVGPRLLNEDGTLQSQGYLLNPFFWTFIKSFRLERILPRFISRRFFPWTDGQAFMPMRTGWVSGACMLVSKMALEKAGGGLCEELQFYGEEIEWCWRAKNAGMEVWCLPDVTVLHFGGGSTKKGIAPESIFSINKQMKNALLLAKKTNGIPSNICVSCIIVLGSIIRLCYYSSNKSKRNIVFFDLKNQIRFLKMQIAHVLGF